MKKLLIVFYMISLGLAVPARAADEVSANAPQSLFQVSYSEAEQAVSDALSDKGAGNMVAATLLGHKTEALYSYSKPVSVEVHGLQFDKASGHWNASLLFKAGDDVITAMPSAGHFEEMIEAPVLKRQVRNGEVISATDVELRRFPLAQTRTDTITDIDNLIGKSPLRTISPSRPVREQEITMPAVVKKNSLVQMRYVSPGMEITASGQAMAEGARGDVIEVKNTSSKKIVHAVVEDASTVNILPTGIQTSHAEKVMPYAAN